MSSLTVVWCSVLKSVWTKLRLVCRWGASQSELDQVTQVFVTDRCAAAAPAATLCSSTNPCPRSRSFNSLYYLHDIIVCICQNCTKYVPLMGFVITHINFDICSLIQCFPIEDDFFLGIPWDGSEFYYQSRDWDRSGKKESGIMWEC